MFPFKIPSVAYPSTGGSPSALFNWRYVANSDPLFAQLLLSSSQPGLMNVPYSEMKQGSEMHPFVISQS